MRGVDPESRLEWAQVYSDPLYQPFESTDLPRLTVKEKTSITSNYSFPHYSENKDTVILLSDRKTNIKTESQQKEECAVVPALHPLVLVKICDDFFSSLL